MDERVALIAKIAAKLVLLGWFRNSAVKEAALIVSLSEQEAAKYEYP